MGLLLENNKIKIEHDGIINIAIGRNRKEKNWKNKNILWSDFINKVSKTHRTSESYKDYLKLEKSMQDEIKDIGGFVGGFINGGRRKSENIMNRQLITLDMDFGSYDIWDSYKLIYGNSAILYSTHKHSKITERYRIVIPLDREVSREEYQAISRKIAGDLDINAFDDTTFESARLMYWPSTSKDGDFVFDYIDAKWLSADSILKSYCNWEDTSLWPVSEKQKAIVKTEIKNQEDPLEKKGLVGAFCRIYTIQESIDKFLSDVYESFTKDRYTYKNGSTVAAL